MASLVIIIAPQTLTDAEVIAAWLAFEDRHGFTPSLSSRINTATRAGTFAY